MYKVLDISKPDVKRKWYAVGTDMEYFTHTICCNKKETEKMAKEINERYREGKVKCPYKECGHISQVSGELDDFNRIYMDCEKCGKHFPAILRSSSTNDSNGDTAMQKKTATKKAPAKKPATKKATAKKPATKAPAKKAPAKKAPAKRGPSQVDKLKEMFKAKTAQHSIEDIAKKLGTDTRNAAVTVSIAKNPKRTKEPLLLERDAKTKKYKRAK